MPAHGLNPENVWKHFGEIARIPRGSKNEAAAAAHVLQTAARLGLKASQDKAGNVVVRKPASPGREGRRSLCLQSHLDMVCVKEPGKQHDFLKDAIEIVLSGDYLTANGTTLGADNGIGVALALAALEDKSLEHGPIECLFTIDEESGMTGAMNLQPDFLQSRTLLNLDSEEEGILYVGSAGGTDTVGRWTLATETAPPGLVAVEIRVKGLSGGHSGVEIHKGRANALKLMTRLLRRLDELGARLSSLEGGSARNVIPSTSAARIWIPEGKVQEASRAVDSLRATFQAEGAAADPDLEVHFDLLRGESRADSRAGSGAGSGADSGTQDARVLASSLQHAILRTLTAMPTGVNKMSLEIPGLVETSTNLAVARTTAEALTVETSQRSSVASEISEMAACVRSIFELGGAAVQSGTGYPAWKPNLSSEIMAVAKAAHLAVTGKEQEVKSMHAGLECGLIGERVPGMDMVSLGPELAEVHTPRERVLIPSVERFCQLLPAILAGVR